MPREPRTEVVTAFVTRGRELLVLRRSQSVRTYAGRWAGVSGYLECDDPLRQARIELIEELGLGEGDVVLRSRGEPLDIDDGEGREWRVHPFRFTLVEGKEPRLDWEHVELKWIAPEQLDTLEAVPGLSRAWRAVLREDT